MRDSVINIIEHAASYRSDVKLVMLIAKDGIEWPEPAIVREMMTSLKLSLQKKENIRTVTHSNPPFWAGRDSLVTDESSGHKYKVTSKNIDRYLSNILGNSLVLGEHVTSSLSDIEQVIINDTFYEELKKTNEEVIGKELRSDKPIKIVGVVSSLKFERDQFLIFHGPRLESTTFLIEYKYERSDDLESLKNNLNQFSESFVVGWFVPMSDFAKEHLLQDGAKTLISIFISVSTLIFTVIGLINIIQYQLSIRLIEYKIRLSVGATFTDIYLRLIKYFYRPYCIAILSTLLVYFAGSSMNMVDSSAVYSLIYTAIIITLLFLLTIYLSARENLKSTYNYKF